MELELESLIHLRALLVPRPSCRYRAPDVVAARDLSEAIELAGGDGFLCRAELRGEVRAVSFCSSALVGVFSWRRCASAIVDAGSGTSGGGRGD